VSRGCYGHAVQRKARLNQMVAAIVENTSLDVPSLASMFEVSEATVRRDLETLEQQRLVHRTHGGATTHASFHDLPLSYKTAQDLPEKRRIAQRARGLLDHARVIGLTGGTTVTEFARLLSSVEGLTVVTNALNIAVELSANPRRQGQRLAARTGAGCGRAGRRDEDQPGRARPGVRDGRGRRAHHRPARGPDRRGGDQAAGL